jgi:CHAT domain-containing protein
VNILELFSSDKKTLADDFYGVGNPNLNSNASGISRMASSEFFLRNGQADVTKIRELPSLPDTENEILALSELFEGDKKVLFKDEANEINVKKEDLSKYDVIAFATHGLMAGDFSFLGEPALVLTPPEESSDENDGLLTASEILQFNLNAQVVLLSACNTAAADGSPSAQGLSGLARSFFFAGAKSLLVSHWSTISEAATRLTIDMMTRYKNNKVDIAEALRLSMINLINDKSKPYYAHPIYWAPFTIVGTN